MARTRPFPKKQVKPSKQLPKLHKEFTEDGIMKIFNMMPPGEDFFFRSIVGTYLHDIDNMLEVKLFLGETLHYQTWAVVKLFPKATQVLIVNAYETGDSSTMEDIEDMALMYPFKIFKAYKDNAYSLHQLRAMILYVFMYAKQGTDLFAMDLDTAKKFLVSGVKRMAKIYKMKGGVKQIPGPHKPSDDLTDGQPGEFVDDDEEDVFPEDGMEIDGASDGDGEEDDEDDGDDDSDNDDGLDDDKDVDYDEDGDEEEAENDKDIDEDDKGVDEEGDGEALDDNTDTANDDSMHDSVMVDTDESVEDKVIDEDYVTQSPHDDHARPTKKQKVSPAGAHVSSLPIRPFAVEDRHHGWHEPPPITGPGARQKAVFRQIYAMYMANPEMME